VTDTNTILGERIHLRGNLRGTIFKASRNFQPRDFYVPGIHGVSDFGGNLKYGRVPVKSVEKYAALPSSSDRHAVRSGDRNSKID